MQDQAAPQCCVVIDSIGSASPTDVGAVAKGLGLAAEETVKAVYRAPVVLADKLERAVAKQLTGLLAKLGFASSIAEQAELKLPPAALFDIVVRVEQPEHTLAVAEVVALFCGTDLAEAMRLLFTPPGLVLGGVSQASVDALEARVDGLGARVIASRPHKASYDLFAHGLPDALARRLRGELGQRGAEGEGVFAGELPYAEANRLWRTYGRSGHVAIVDRAFQHFDIVLEAIADGADEAAQQALLQELYGIPPAAYPRLVAAGEVVLGENRTYERMATDIGALAEVGLFARAELATFAQRAVSIDGIELSLARQILAGFGIEGTPTALPATTAPLPLAMARALHATVRGAGGKARFVEDDHG